MKVPNLPGSGKDTAEAKGVHREVESEERIRQNSGLLHLRLNAGIRLPNKLKSDNCTELYLVFMRGKERVSTRGGLVDVSNAIKHLRKRLK